MFSQHKRLKPPVRSTYPFSAVTWLSHCSPITLLSCPPYQHSHSKPACSEDFWHFWKDKFSQSSSLFLQAPLKSNSIIQCVLQDFLGTCCQSVSPLHPWRQRTHLFFLLGNGSFAAQCSPPLWVSLSSKTKLGGQFCLKPHQLSSISLKGKAIAEGQPASLQARRLEVLTAALDCGWLDRGVGHRGSGQVAEQP